MEIGNEPGREGWQRYFHLARLAAPIIHAQGKRMVLAAPMNVDTIDYLKAAKAEGMFARVDGVAIHPYAPTAFRVQERVGDARSIVPLRLPLWITEVGWGTGPNRDGGCGGLEDGAAERPPTTATVGVLGGAEPAKRGWCDGRLQDAVPGSVNGHGKARGILHEH